jgi:hypothetical protein
MSFDRYLATRQNAACFVPDPDKFEELAFTASLASFEDLARWTHGMRNARGEALSFNAGYADTMRPDAFADLFEGRHVIGMHQALLVTIIEFALYVFTQADLFPQIGDAAGEDSPAPQFGAAPGILLLDRTLRGETIEPEFDIHRVPKDADRHSAAVYMAMIMTRFVWLHELAHCAKGHVLFLKESRIIAPLGEIPDPLAIVGLRKPSFSNDQVRTLLHGFEREADEAALIGCCRVQVAGAENIDGIKAFDFATRLETSLLGSYLMTWLFDEYQRHTNSHHNLSHPFPHDRLRYLVRAAHALLEPELDGFAEFHEGVLARFNRLADKIPGMHRIDPLLLHSARRDDAFDLDALLAPFRFEATG